MDKQRKDRQDITIQSSIDDGLCTTMLATSLRAR